MPLFFGLNAIPPPLSPAAKPNLITIVSMGRPPLEGVSHILRTTALGCCLTTFSISDKAKAVPLNSNTGEERTLEKNQRQPADFLKGRVQEKAGKPKIRRRDSRLEMQRKFY
jgi:hypothetical protein